MRRAEGVVCGGWGSKVEKEYYHSGINPVEFRVMNGFLYEFVEWKMKRKFHCISLHCILCIVLNNIVFFVLY